MTPPDAASSRLQVPIVPGDTFIDPLSGKALPVSSARILSEPGLASEKKVMPCAGGYQAFLDAAVLACEVRALDALRELYDAASGELLLSCFPIIIFSCFVNIA